MKRILAYIFALLTSFSCFCKDNESDFLSTLNSQIIISHNCNHIWSDKSGTSWINQTSAEFITSSILKTSCKASYTNLLSSLPYFSSNITIPNVSTALYFNHIGLKTAGFYAFSKKTSVSLDKKEYINDGFRALGGIVELPIRFENFTIQPFFAQMTLSSLKGSFYWFHGNPSIPKMFVLGSSIDIKSWSIISFYSNANIKIDNNEDYNLADINASLYAIAGSKNFSFGKWSIKPSAIYAYMLADFSALLSSQTQQYLFYPYKTYSADGTLNAHFAALELCTSYTKDKLKLALNGLFCYVPYQNGRCSTEWLYKKNFLFDGSTGKKDIDLQYIDKSGAAIIDVCLAYNLKKLPIELSISKAFVIPFSFKVISFSYDFGSSDSQKKNTHSHSRNGELVFDYLLSCLSISANIKVK